MCRLASFPTLGPTWSLWPQCCSVLWQSHRKWLTSYPKGAQSQLKRLDECQTPFCPLQEPHLCSSPSPIKLFPSSCLQGKAPQCIDEGKQDRGWGRKRDIWNVYNFWAIAQPARMLRVIALFHNVKGRVASSVGASYGQQHRYCGVALRHIFETTPFLKKYRAFPFPLPLCMWVSQESKNIVTTSQCV